MTMEHWKQHGGVHQADRSLPAAWIYRLVVFAVAMGLVVLLVVLPHWAEWFCLLILTMLGWYTAQYLNGKRAGTGERQLRRMSQTAALAARDSVEENHPIAQMTEQQFLALTRLVTAHDPYVTEHARRVVGYASALAAALDLPVADQNQIRQAALLHDVGKLSIPETILHKVGKLSHEEYEIVKRHAQLGADLLETSVGLRHLAPIIRHHHERWDGQGYPSGLRGEEIPLAARILTLCDAVDVMASGRHYESAKPFEAIVLDLQRNMGTQFDPMLVDTFLDTLDGQGLAMTAVPASGERAKAATLFPRAAFLGQMALSA